MTRRAPASAPRAAPRAPARREAASTPPLWWRRVTWYHAASRSGATAALCSLPLFLAYGLGQLMASEDALNGVDLVSGGLRALFGEQGYAWAIAGVAALTVVVAALRLRATLPRHALLTLPVALEATVYGLLMGSVILVLMEEAKLLGPLLVPSEWVDRVVISAGAGFHEELVFRLAMVPLLLVAARRLLGMPPTLAALVAVAASSALFAGAHHLAGEPFEAFAFTYRTLAGGVFAALFLARGFAVAAWTHAAYDFYVLSA